MANDFVQVMTDGQEDAKTLSVVVNGDEQTQVETRLGESYPSVKKAIKSMIQAGVGFTSFETKSLMIASSLANGTYAIVANDTSANNGLHLKKSGTWSKVTWDIDERQKAYADTAKDTAINTASTDATTKASEAKTQATAIAIDVASDDATYKANAALAAAAIDATLKASEAKTQAVAIATDLAAADATRKTNELSAITKALLEKEKNKGRPIVSCGESDLEALSGLLQEFAAEGNSDFYNYTDTYQNIAGLGMVLGVNVVTIKFPLGEIKNDVNVPVTITTSFDDYGSSLVLQLEDGTVGVLNPQVPQFKALTDSKTVSSATIFNTKPISTRPSNAFYIFNTGKRDALKSIGNIQYITDKTDEMVKSLPLGADFVVLGLFSNTNSNTETRDHINNINDVLRNKYLTRFLSVNDILFDDATWLKLGISKTASDITAITNKRLPPSLATGLSSLSPSVNTILAGKVTERISNEYVAPVLTNVDAVKDVAYSIIPKNNIERINELAKLPDNTYGYYIRSTSGELYKAASNPDVTASEYFVIDKTADTLKISGFGNGLIALYALYDKDKGVISTSVGSNNGKQVISIAIGDLPSNSHYIRYTGYKDYPSFVDGVVVPSIMAEIEKKISNVSDHSLSTVFLTGASLAYSGNTWFASAVEKLGVTGINTARSGFGIYDDANSFWRDTFFTAQEFEDIDVFCFQYASPRDLDSTVGLKATAAEYEVGRDKSSPTNPWTEDTAAQNLDYILKLLQQRCYQQKDNSASKWFGTQHGKPFRLMFITSWHDSRPYNSEPIRRLADRWGAGLCPFDRKIGFSKNQPLPDGTQVSVLYAEDTQVIDGVTYGWHPKRGASSDYIQNRMASIFKQAIVDWFGD